MEVLSDRISAVRDEKGASIVISALANRNKSRSAAILLVLWLVGGVLMMIGFPSITGDKARLVFIIWIAFWFYFLYVLARLWRWKKYGHEIIKITDDALKYKKDVKGRGWVLDFKRDKITKLRVSDITEPNWLKNIGGDFWNTDCDSLRFNYEDREVSFGYLLDDKERQKLLGLLSEFVNADDVQSRRSQKEASWKKKD